MEPEDFQALYDYLYKTSITNLGPEEFFAKYSQDDLGRGLYDNMVKFNNTTYQAAPGRQDTLKFTPFLPILGETEGADAGYKAFHDIYFGTNPFEKKKDQPAVAWRQLHDLGLQSDGGSSVSSTNEQGLLGGGPVIQTNPDVYPFGAPTDNILIPDTELSEPPVSKSLREEFLSPVADQSKMGTLEGELAEWDRLREVNPNMLLWDVYDEEGKKVRSSGRLIPEDESYMGTYLQKARPEIGYWTSQMGWLGRVIDDTYRALDTGAAQADVVPEAQNMITLGNEISDEDLMKYIQAVEEMHRIGPSEDMIRMRNDYEAYGGDFFAGMRALMENADGAGEVLISSYSSMLNQESITTFAEGFAATEAAFITGGATVGTFIGPEGTAAGAVSAAGTGLPFAINTGMAMAGGQLEQLLSLGFYIQDEINRKYATGVVSDTDWSRDNVRAVLQDEMAWGRVTGRANARGQSVGITEFLGGMLSINVGGRMLASGNSRLLTGTTIGGIESATGYTGETFAQIYAEEDPNQMERILEGVGGFPQSLVYTGVSALKTGKFYINDTEVSKNAMLGFLGTDDLEAIGMADLKATRSRYVKRLIEEKKFEASIDQYLPNYLIGDTRAQVIKLERQRQALLQKQQDKGKLRVFEQEALDKLGNQIDAIQQAAYDEFSDHVENRVQFTGDPLPIRGAYRTTELLNRPVQLLWYGSQDFEPALNGVLFQDGQRVIFETADGRKQYDLGNRTFLERTLSNGQGGVEGAFFRSDESFGSHFGLAHDHGTVSTSSAGSIFVEGKTYEMLGFEGVPKSILEQFSIQEDLGPIYPSVLDKDGNVVDFGPLIADRGIFYDENGDVVAVAMYDVLARGMRTFSGQQAEDLAYQILLRELQSPEQIEKVNEALERDARFREAFEAHQRKRAEITPERFAERGTDAAQLAAQGADPIVEDIPERDRTVTATPEQIADRVFLRDASSLGTVQIGNTTINIPTLGNVLSLGQLIQRREFTSRRALPQSMWEFDNERLSQIAAVGKTIEMHMRDLDVIFKDLETEDLSMYLKDYSEFLGGDFDAGSRLTPQMRAHAEEARAIVDGWTIRGLNSGAFPTDMVPTIEGNLGQYLNRSYKVFNDPNWKNKWEAQLGEEEVNRVKGFLRRQLTHTKVHMDGITKRMEETGEDYNVAVENYMEHYIQTSLLEKENWKMDALGRAKYNFGKEIGIMQERMDIPEPIRALMGEETDPMYQWFNTVTKLANTVLNHEYQVKIRDAGLGVYFFEQGQTPAGQENIFTVKMAEESSKAYSPLGGLYTSREIAQELAQPRLEASSNEIFRIFNGVTGTAKWMNTIGSAYTHVRNALGNIEFMANNGHFNIPQFSTAFRAIQEDFRSLSDNSWRERYLRYTELGLTGQSANLGDVRSTLINSNWEQLSIDRLARRPDNLLQGAGKAALKGKRAAEKVYSGTDEFFKIYAFENDLRRYAKALYGREYGDLSPQALTELENYVAKIVLNTYPTYSRVPRIVQRAGRSPLFADFVSFESEAYRTYYNQIELMLSEITSDNPGLRSIGAQRLAGLTAASAAKHTYRSSVGLGYGSMGLIGMFTDDGEEADSYREMVSWAMPQYIQNADELLDDQFFSNYLAPSLFPALRTEDQERMPNYYLSENVVFLESDPGHVKFLLTGSVEPYAGMDRVFNAATEGFTGKSNIHSDTPAIEGFARGFIETLKPFMTESMVINTLSEIGMSSETAQVYNPNDPWQKQTQDVINYVYGKVFEPGTTKSVWRLSDLEVSPTGEWRKKFPETPLQDRLSELGGFKTVDVDLHDAFRTVLYAAAKDRRFAYRQRGEKDVEIGEASAAAEQSYEDLLIHTADIYMKCLEAGCDKTILDVYVKDALGFERDSEDWVKARSGIREGLTLGIRSPYRSDQR